MTDGERTASTASGRSDVPEAYLILPTLNEREGLAQTYASIPLAALRTAGHSVDVVVLDGGSTDGTLEVAQRLGLRVVHQKTRGKGMAVREALEWVAAQGAPFAVVMDADCTYPPEMIGPALELLKAGGDLVVGVRQPVLTKPLGPRDLVHRVGNTILNYMATQATAHTVLDLCSGFYGIDLRTKVHEGLTATGFEIEAELFLKAYRSGLTVLQIPITYRERVGEAKLRAVHDGARIFVAILRSRDQPTVLPRAPAARPGPLLRELLSACFVHGSRELIVITHPSRRAEAERLVARLKGGHFSNAVILSENAPENGGPSPPSPTGAAVLHLAEEVTQGPESGTTVMYLPNTRRTIRLDLNRGLGSMTTPAAGPVDPSPNPEFARSGARPVMARTGRLGGSVATLGSILDPNGLGKEMAFLGANGLRPEAVTPSDRPPRSNGEGRSSAGRSA